MNSGKIKKTIESYLVPLSLDSEPKFMKSQIVFLNFIFLLEVYNPSILEYGCLQPLYSLSKLHVICQFEKENKTTKKTNNEKILYI